MTLPADVARCLGQLPSPYGEVPCSRRNECARYRQRCFVGPATPVYQWLCPTSDDYYGRFIKQEPKE